MIVPVSVCVPHVPERDQLLNCLVLPCIAANDPAEILIEHSQPNGSANRNAAAKRATQPYLFFCDDDVVLHPEALRRLAAVLDGRSDASYVYCNYVMVNHPRRGNDIHTAGGWNYDRLKQFNYISTMSMIRRELFPGFDENLSRLQDYDLWLTMAEKGQQGVWLDQTLFAALYVGDCVTQSSGFDEAMKMVHDKHKL